jgi:hypothetical protein
MKPLVLYLKKEYFEQVKSGNKIEEYREVKPYWTKRLVGKEFSLIEIRGGGYGTPRTPENTIVFPWQGCSVKKLVEHPLFGKTVDVYAIKLVK